MTTTPEAQRIDEFIENDIDHWIETKQREPEQTEMFEEE